MVFFFALPEPEVKIIPLAAEFSITLLSRSAEASFVTFMPLPDGEVILLEVTFILFELRETKTPDAPGEEQVFSFTVIFVLVPV